MTSQTSPAAPQPGSLGSFWTKMARILIDAGVPPPSDPNRLPRAAGDAKLRALAVSEPAADACVEGAVLLWAQIESITCAAAGQFPAADRANEAAASAHVFQSHAFEALHRACGASACARALSKAALSPLPSNHSTLISEFLARALGVDSPLRIAPEEILSLAQALPRREPAPLPCETENLRWRQLHPMFALSEPWQCDTALALADGLAGAFAFAAERPDLALALKDLCSPALPRARKPFEAESLGRRTAEALGPDGLQGGPLSLDLFCHLGPHFAAGFACALPHGSEPSAQAFHSLCGRLRDGAASFTSPAVEPLCDFLLASVWLSLDFERAAAFDAAFPDYADRRLPAALRRRFDEDKPALHAFQCELARNASELGLAPASPPPKTAGDAVESLLSLWARVRQTQIDPGPAGPSDPARPRPSL